MTYPFLSDEWFSGVAQLIEEHGVPELPEKLRGVTMNVIVKDGFNGQPVEATFRGCYFEPGHSGDAQALLTTTRDLAYEVMIKKNAAMGVRALATGKAKLNGDRKQLMPLASVRPSDAQKQFEKRVLEITEL
jgi:hypothetical protein